MKVTRYPQSCLTIEKNGKKIVIDPGNVFTQIYKVEDLGAIDAVLYTHSHADHFDISIVEQFRDNGVVMYGNSSVVNLIGNDAVEVVDGQEFEVAGFSVLPRDLDHCLMPDGSNGPHNTGFVVDGTFFHPGDGIKIDNLQVPDLALPIAGPDISFTGAIAFVKSLGARCVIPIHFDNHGTKPELLNKYNESFALGLEVIILQNGQSVEL